MKPDRVVTFMVLIVVLSSCMSPPPLRSTPAGQVEEAPATQPSPTLASLPTGVPTISLTQSSAGPADTQPPGAGGTINPTQPELPEGDTHGSPASKYAKLIENSRAIRRDLTYCTVDGVELKFDFFLPKRQTGDVPLVIHVHGGGWSKGDKRGGASLVYGPELLAAGFALASLNYRLAPQYEFPAMIEDVKCAIRFFRAHAGEYRFDPSKIGIFGSSAGAHLSSLVGTSDQQAGFDVGEFLDQSSRVQAVVDFFGPADLTVNFSGTYAELKPTVFANFDLKAASPVTYISSDDPPFLILHGDMDRVVPISQSQMLYDQLVSGGVIVNLVVVKNGTHGFGTDNITPTRDELTAMMVNFFNEHLN